MAFVDRATPTGQDGTSSTTTISNALAVTAGRSIVVVWSTQEDGGQTHTVADTAGNTYGSPVVSSPGTLGCRVRIWVAHNCLPHASNVVTVTSSTAHRYKAVDQIQLNMGGTGTTDTSGSEDNAGSTDGVVTGLSATGNGTIIYGTSSTNDRSWNDAGISMTELGDTGAGFSSGYRDITGAGTYSGGATAASASNVCVAVAIFKDAAGGGGAATMRRSTVTMMGVGAI